MKRTLSTIGLWTIVLGTVALFGVGGGVLLLAVFTTLAQYELQVLLEKSGLPPWKYATLALGFAMVLQAGINLPCGVFLGLIGVIALVLGALACAQNPTGLHRLAGSVLALAYVPGMMLCYAIILRRFGMDCRQGNGEGLVIWVIAVAKFTDVGGYLVGSAIGRHKLAPSISPGKTWEGVMGGLMLAMVVSLGIYRFLPNWLPWWFLQIHALWLPIPIGIAAIISDLSESAIKRRAGVKDSGNCIPGIGGALDLADSLLLSAPVAFYLLSIFQGDYRGPWVAPWPFF